MKLNIKAFLQCAFVLSSQIGFSQAFNIEWQKSYWGTIYPTSPHQPNPPVGPNGEDLHFPEKKLSGEDWFFYHSLSKGTDNQPNGYICGGYSTFINYVEKDRPQGTYSGDELGTPNCSFFEKPNYMKGSSKQILSLINLEGQVLWYRTYANGDISTVIQTADGGYVAIGAGKSSEDGKGNEVYYNPRASQPPDGYASFHAANHGTSTKNRKIRILKVTRNGLVEWQYMYGMKDYTGTGIDAFNHLSRTSGGAAGGGIVQASNGDLLFTAYAQCQKLPPNQTETYERLFVMRISSTGMLIWKGFYGTPDVQSWGTAITKIGTGASEKFYVSGRESTPQGWKAILFEINNSTTLDAAPVANWTNSYVKTGGNASWAGTTIGVNNAGKLILPVVHNITSAGFYGYKAEALVYTVDPVTHASSSPISFGPICAYDLTVGVTATTDGGFAVVSSTNRNYNATDPDYFFPTQSTNPVNPNDPNSYCGYSHLNELYKEYGFNDGYAAKCNAAGVKEWENVFDNGIYGSRPDGPTNTWIYPDPANRDLRRTECFYTIVEAPDGGFVVAGNNSENFDDCYVAKLSRNCKNLALSDITVKNKTIQDISYNAPTSITASKVTVAAGSGNVNFKAGNQILLSTEFIVENGAKFLAQISTCTPQRPSASSEGNEITSLVDESKWATSLEVYPNPTNGVFTIQTGSENIKSIYVYNLTGSLIFERTAITENQFNVNISEQPQGIYLIKVLEGNQVKTTKIVRQ